MEVLKKSKKNKSTDFALMVDSIAKVESIGYDEKYIVDSLVKEVGIDKKVAETIATEVSEKLKNTNLDKVTTSLIRSFVNVVLLEKGYNKEMKSNSDVTIPFYDIVELIENANKENGNTTHSPESINLNLAERVIKEYALEELFDKDISDSHLKGEIHIHDLGMVNRYYCSGHSPEYVKRNGLRNIPSIPTNSSPASSAYVLARHICSMTQFMQGQFAGAIGWEALNVFFAPLLRGMEYDEIKQIAETLIFDLSQLAGARGGQVAFTDFNVYAAIPKHYLDVYAVGKKGRYMVEDYLGEIHYFKSREETEKFAKDNGFKILRYKDYSNESRDFVRAILEVIEKGDADGMPFPFPKINLHIDEESFINNETSALIMKAAKSASVNGCPYFIFDRNACSISQCCRLKIDFDEEDMKLIDTPEELRFVGGQNVSINLPNIPLKVGKDESKVYEEIEKRIDIACRAHITRKDYVTKVANVKNSPVSFYNKGMDGKPYINVNKISWLVGIVGLNECVYNLIGKELHEDDEAYLKGLEIITFMYRKMSEYSKKYGINLKLEETPAESTSMRFAKLDKKHYADKAYYKSNEFGNYYSNSIHFATDSDVDYVERLMKQSKFHSIVEAGSMIHIWGGENNPDPKAIYELLKYTWYKTKCVQWVLSPEYTICKDCNTKANGLLDKCSKCGSENVRGITRITGYYVYTDNFNAGKRAELNDRKREKIN